MRSADELILAAVNEHKRLMDDGKDPVEHVFYVTQEELATLRDLPPVYHPALNANRDRLCGFMLNVVSDLHLSTVQCVPGQVYDLCAKEAPSGG